MKILNNNSDLVAEYNIYHTKDINANKSLEKMLNTRLKLFFYNCPREYLHLIDISTWFVIEDYNIEKDEDYNTLFMILDSRYRLVLISKAALDKIKDRIDKEPDIGYTLMENSDDLYLLYISDDKEENDTLAYYLSKNIDKTRMLSSNGINYMQSNLEFIYDDNLISILFKTGILVLTEIIDYDSEGDKKGVLCKYKQDLYFLPMNISKNGTMTVNFSNKILMNGSYNKEGINYFITGDMVKYDSIDYIVSGAYYGKVASDVTTQGYRIVNVKTGSIVNNVSPFELKPQPRFRLTLV